MNGVMNSEAFFVSLEKNNNNKNNNILFYGKLFLTVHYTLGPIVPFYFVYSTFF